jgi:basic membrane protein A
MDTTVWNDGFTQDDYKALVKALADGSVTVTVDAAAAEPTADTVAITFLGNIK